jgi:hypothetical protein
LLLGCCCNYYYYPTTFGSLNEEPWTESPRLCVCLSFFFRGNQIRCCCCCCKWVVASPGCCNTCYGSRGCSRLICLQLFDTSAACYFELTIPCALTRAHTHKKREMQKATYKAAVQQQAGANASPM